MEAEGGVGICVDPPVTVVLDTSDFRFAVMGWYDGYGSTFSTELTLTRAIATRKSAVSIELPPLRMNFLFWC